MPYAFDFTGQALQNQVIGEAATLTLPAGKSHLFVLPEFGPYFETSMVIKYTDSNGNSRILVEFVDWYPAFQYKVATANTNKPIYGGIGIIDNTLRGNLVINYQTVGGLYPITSIQSAAVLANENRDPAFTIWENVVTGLPAFPVCDYNWAMLNSNNVQLMTQQLAGVGLAVHLRPQFLPTPEQVVYMPTAAEIGLGNVNNYQTATNAEGIAGVATNKFMTPASTNAAVSGLVSSYLSATGYTVATAYAAGLVINSTTQTYSYNGDVYVARSGAIPFTASGTFESANFMLVNSMSRKTWACVTYTVTGSEALAANGAQIIPTGLTLDSKVASQIIVNNTSILTHKIGYQIDNGNIYLNTPLTTDAKVEFYYKREAAMIPDYRYFYKQFTVISGVNTFNIGDLNILQSDLRIIIANAYVCSPSDFSLTNGIVTITKALTLGQVIEIENISSAFTAFTNNSSSSLGLSALTLTYTGIPSKSFGIFLIYPPGFQSNTTASLFTGKWISNIDTTSLQGTTAFTFADLEGIAGINFSLTNNTTLTTLNFTTLKFLSNDLNLTSDSALTTLNCPALTTINGNLVLTSLSTFTTITLTALTTIGASIIVSNNTSITNLSISSLITLGLNIAVSGNTNLASISMNSLTNVNGDITIITGNTNLANISFSSLATVLGNISMQTSLITSLITSFNLNSLNACSNLYLVANAATNISLPALVSCGSSTLTGTMLIGGGAVTAPALIFCTSLSLECTSFSAPLLSGIGQPLTNAYNVSSTGLKISSNTRLINLYLPALTYINSLLDGYTCMHITSTTTLTTINLPALTTIAAKSTFTTAGGITVYGNTALTTVILSSLTTIQAGPNMIGVGSGFATLAFLTNTNVGFTTLSLPALTTITNSNTTYPSINISGNTYLTSISMPLLTNPGGDIVINSTAANSLNLNSLITCRNLSISLLNSNAYTYNFPALTSVTGYLSLGAGNFTMNNLLTISNGLNFSYSGTTLSTTYTFNSLTSINASLLGGVNNSGLGIYITNTVAITTFSLPAIVSIYGATGSYAIFINCSTLTSFTLGSNLKLIAPGTNGIYIVGCPLTQACVDALFISIAALNGANGTTSYVGAVIISGGTCAAPSATGLAACATLTARGCTVTHA